MAQSARSTEAVREVRFCSRPPAFLHWASEKPESPDEEPPDAFGAVSLRKVALIQPGLPFSETCCQPSAVRSVMVTCLPEASVVKAS